MSSPARQQKWSQVEMSKEDRKAVIAARLRAARENAGLSQGQAAKELSVTLVDGLTST